MSSLSACSPSKISGYADKQWAKEHPDRALRGANSIRAMHALEAFLLALSNRSVDGRILVTTEQAKDKISPPSVTLKYLLLNPADAFRPLLDSARAIVLAGGTMEPVRHLCQDPASDSTRCPSSGISSLVKSLRTDSPLSPVATLCQGAMSRLRLSVPVQEDTSLSSTIRLGRMQTC